MVFYTSICSNYFDKAAALADSIKTHMPNAVFVVGLVEENVPAEAPAIKSIDHIILAKDLGIKNFYSFVFKHRIVEASTAIKGALSLELLRRFPNETHFTFLDPDCYVFSNFENDLKQQLAQHDFGLTPHLLSPGNIDMEISTLKHGVFNLGFLTFKRSPEASKFLQWWADRLHDFCYEDFERGLFTDQKWINLAQCFFEPKIIRDPGYNFATWNFMERQISTDGANKFLIDERPLKFVHFSGQDKNTFAWAAKQWGSPSNQQYADSLLKIYGAATAPYSMFKSIPWTYAKYSDGQTIPDEARIAIRKNGATSENPFVKAN